MRVFINVMLIFIVGICLSCAPAKAQDQWETEVIGDRLYVGVTGKIINEDKLRFMLLKGSCENAQFIFTFYTTVDDKNINSLLNATVPVVLNFEKMSAQVNYVAPFLSGHQVMFSLGVYDIEGLINSFARTDSLKITILDNGDSLKNFKAEDYFNIRENLWDMGEFKKSLNDAKAKCLAME